MFIFLSVVQLDSFNTIIMITDRLFNKKNSSLPAFLDINFFILVSYTSNLPSSKHGLQQNTSEKLDLLNAIFNPLSEKAVIYI